MKEGDAVKAGQAIAERWATSPPIEGLHFEIRRNGKPSNPLDSSPRAVRRADGCAVRLALCLRHARTGFSRNRFPAAELLELVEVIEPRQDEEVRSSTGAYLSEIGLIVACWMPATSSASGAAVQAGDERGAS